MATAAYASLLSVRQVIGGIRQHHDSERITLWDTQQLRSLDDIALSLQEFLEKNRSSEAEDLLLQIPVLATEIQATLDGEIVNQLKRNFAAGFTCFIRPVELFILKVQDSINNGGLSPKRKKIDDCGLAHTVESQNAPGSTIAFTPKDRIAAVGIYKDVESIIDNLSGSDPRLRTIMVYTGGFEGISFFVCLQRDPRIQTSFELLWGDISDESSALSTLRSFVGVENGQGSFEDLGEKLHKKLLNRKYCILLSDSSYLWKQLRQYLPDDRNGSAVIVCTASTKSYGTTYPHYTLAIDDKYKLDEYTLGIDDFSNEKYNLVLDRIPKQLYACDHTLLDAQQLQSLQAQLESLQRCMDDHHHSLGYETESLIRETLAIVVKSRNLADQLGGYTEQGFSSVIEPLDKLIKRLDSIRNSLLLVKLVNVDISSVHSFSADVSLENTRDRATAAVGFDKHVEWVMEKIKSEERSLQVIPIVGMGGIGKTTLARCVFDKISKTRRFDREYWCTMSQESNVLHVLKSILKDRSHGNQLEDGHTLHEELSGYRYLIVLDNMWTSGIYEQLQPYLPEGMQSRIIVTTRMSDVADSVKSQHSYPLEFLNENESWTLLQQKVFDGDDCPDSLVEIGKNVAKSCGGLPLSLVTISGVLSKSKSVLDWNRIAQDMRRVYGGGDYENCFKILSLSYSVLPIYLKTCFLYFAFFLEEEPVRVTELLRCWISSGLVKPVEDRTMQDVAEGYLKEMINRYLVSVRGANLIGKINYCGVHDLLREFCIREIEKEKFLATDIPRLQIFDAEIKSLCNLCSRSVSQACNLDLVGLKVCQNCVSRFPYLCRSRFVNFTYFDCRVGSYEWRKKCDQLLPKVTAICHRCKHLSSVLEEPVMLQFPQLCESCMELLSSLLYMSLVPEGEVHFTHPNPTTVQYINCKANPSFEIFAFGAPSPILLFWNLQFLVIEDYFLDSDSFFPDEIWEMQRLKHLEISDFCLPEPEMKKNVSVLKDLHRLHVKKLPWSEEVAKLLPNLMKLKVNDCWDVEILPDESLQTSKLQSLYLRDSPVSALGSLSSLCSLKKLSLEGFISYDWGAMSAIGRLPNLEVLKLIDFGNPDGEWDTTEEEFPKLKVLLLEGRGPRVWRAEGDAPPFPKLKRLIITRIGKELEVPRQIGDIPTLCSIRLEFVHPIVIKSVVELLKENEILEVHLDKKLITKCDLEDEERLIWA